MVSAWTCDSFSWFQSAIVFTKNEFLNCSVWAVGTIKHLVLLVVSCWTKFEDTWSGKCLGLMCLFFWGGPEECFSGESWDRSSNSSVHEFFSLVASSII